MVPAFISYEHASSVSSAQRFLNMTCHTDYKGKVFLWHDFSNVAGSLL